VIPRELIYAPKYVGLTNKWWKSNKCKHRDLREKPERKKPWRERFHYNADDYNGVYLVCWGF